MSMINHVKENVTDVYKTFGLRTYYFHIFLLYCHKESIEREASLWIKMKTKNACRNQKR